WNKQEVRQSIARQGLNMSWGNFLMFEDQSNDKKKEQEIIGTAATSTKVLSSGKVVGKPVANPAKQEWMQARKNKYQRDKRGYIIDNTKEKEVSNGKGKAKVEAVITNNKFDALEVEENAQPILRITDGKEDDNVTNNVKEQPTKESKKVQEQEKMNKAGDSTLNPKSTGIKVNSGKALWIDEVEYMEAQLVTKNTAEGKEKKDNNQTQKIGSLEAATVNPSSPNTRVYDNSSSKANGTVNPSNSGEIFTIVDGVPVYALRSEQVGDVNMVLEKENLGIMKRNYELNEVSLRPRDQDEQAIVPREIGDIEILPMACTSGDGSPMQIQINVPLKSPYKILHDIITHKKLLVDIQNGMMDKQQHEEGGDDKTTTGNFKAVAREGDLAPRANPRSRKKGKKQTQAKEPLPPTRFLSKRATSTTR
ncbi:hypothetical protein A4A49_13166, partial [Nicotiana attenuata]